MTQEEMKILVPQKLREFEETYQVSILYAVETGSRAWGFASPDSDIYVRFIYKRTREDYLRLDPPRDVIELPIDDVWGVKPGSDDPRIQNPNERQGENLLGFVLMETRDILREWAAFNWDGSWDYLVEWNRSTDQDHMDGEDPDSTQYENTGYVCKDGKTGLLRNNGSEIGRKELLVFYPQWDNCRDMDTGYTYNPPIRQDMYYAVNTRGYYRARLENTFFFVRVWKDGKRGAVDTAGQVITPCKWDAIDKYGNVRQGDPWGFVNLLTCEETAPQWPKSQRLHPYCYEWGASTISNWSSMFNGAKSPEWEDELEIFYTEAVAPSPFQAERGEL